MNNIYILDKISFEKKINKLKADGSINLHIISDWDSTLTKKFFNGEGVGSSFAKLKNNSYLDNDYSSKAESLRNEYRPIQLADDISLDIKSRKMLEWWKKHLDLLICSGMHRNIIMDIISKKEIHPRDGFFEFLDILQKNRIPMFIFSAGLGDFIKEFLISEEKLTDNVNIISNFFKFSEFGKAVSYYELIVHNFNKGEIFINDFSNYENIKDIAEDIKNHTNSMSLANSKGRPICSNNNVLCYRKNAILLGDSIDDAKIIAGSNFDCVIKIGFLNYDVDELLDAYSKNFDVLILNDSSLDYINNLLKEITI